MYELKEDDEIVMTSKQLNEFKEIVIKETKEGKYNEVKPNGKS